MDQIDTPRPSADFPRARVRVYAEGHQRGPLKVTNIRFTRAGEDPRGLTEWKCRDKGIRRSRLRYVARAALLK